MVSRTPTGAELFGLSHILCRCLSKQDNGVRVLEEPLTHQQIIHIAAEFAERGHVLDLVGSSRNDRRLSFKPRIHDNVANGFSIKERISLENPWRGTHRILRELILPNGLVSRLVVSGPKPLDLLCTADSIPLERGFLFGERFILAKSHTHEPIDWSSCRGEGEGQLVFTGAVARAAGLTIYFEMPQVDGYPAKIRIMGSSRESITLPSDLLAVLGNAWRPLEIADWGWTSSLRVRGREPQRSAKNEANVERAVSHIAQTLIEPPSRFQEERARSRWWVQIRCGLPLVFWMSVVLAIVQLSFVSTSWIAIGIAAAPFLIFLLFGLSFLEWSKLTLPERPHRLTADTWWHSAEDAGKCPPRKFTF